ncbi:MAG: alpha/beta fold hydrolase [Myxococcales bacterium]|nr:alpha/beta fold hydrolase [Myxococcales bacterium]
MTSSRTRLAVPTFGGKQLWGDVFLHAGYRIQRNVLTRHHRLLNPADLRLAFGSWHTCHERFRQVQREQEPRFSSEHLVLLLHGIFRSKDSFGAMTRALREEGYAAHALNYPSTRQSIQDHADQLESLLNRMEGVRRVSFVTHSMGGIVARELLSRSGALWRRRIEPNRLLMIGTPNQGAEIAGHLGSIGPFRAVAGPALGQLRPTRADQLPTPDVPFAIIAGGTGDERGYNPLLQGDNDMTVTVAETHLEGAEDFLLVRALHTFIMVNPEVIDAAKRYLSTGKLGATT